MTKIRLILMHAGRVEYDFELEMKKPKLKESITIKTDAEYLDYKVKFIQHFLNEKGKFQYIMVTGIRN